MPKSAVPRCMPGSNRVHRSGRFGWDADPVPSGKFPDASCQFSVRSRLGRIQAQSDESLKGLSHAHVTELEAPELTFSFQFVPLRLDSCRISLARSARREKRGVKREAPSSVSGPRTFHEASLRSAPIDQCLRIKQAIRMAQP